MQQAHIRALCVSAAQTFAFDTAPELPGAPGPHPRPRLGLRNAIALGTRFASSAICLTALLVVLLPHAASATDICTEYLENYLGDPRWEQECLAWLEAQAAARSAQANAMAFSAASQTASATSSGRVLLFEGALDLGLTGIGRATVTGTGVASVNDGIFLETLQIHSANVGGTTIIPITDPVVTAGGLQSIRATVALGAGTLSITTSSLLPILLDNTLPVPGRIRQCLFNPGCATFAETPLTLSETRGVGLGGTIARIAPPRISLVGAPWTIQTASVVGPVAGGGSTTFLAFGFVHGPFSFTFSAAATTNGVGGAIQFVTPVRIERLGEQPIAGFARSLIQFVPEPQLGILTAVPAFLLALLGRRKARRRPDAIPVQPSA